MRLHFLNQLKRSGGKENDLKRFYTSIVRPVTEYCAPAWSTSLTRTLNNRIESIQKRALRTIYPNMNYPEALKSSNLPTLENRRELICKDFFRTIEQTNNKLNKLLPEINQNKVNLRNVRKYKDLKVRTKRYANSFIPFSIKHFTWTIRITAAQYYYYIILCYMILLKIVSVYKMHVFSLYLLQLKSCNEIKYYLIYYLIILPDDFFSKVYVI